MARRNGKVLLRFVATFRGIPTGSTSEPEVTGVVFVGWRRDVSAELELTLESAGGSRGAGGGER